MHLSHRYVSRGLYVALLATTICITDFRVYAQQCAPGELRVSVVDSQQSPIFGTKVQLRSESTVTAELVTEAGGLVNFPRIACGSWTILATKDGFEPKSQIVQLNGAANAEVTIILNPKAQHSTVEVSDQAPGVEQTASTNNQIHPAEVKTLPTNPATVTDTLPLIPGVVRAPNGDLIMEGNGEQRSSLLVNLIDVADPVTGKFGQTVPVDSIETVNVLTTPFLAQYGRFTSSVVAVETRRGGEKWHAELNDPFPDFRIRSWHMRGIRNETPRGVLGGPLVPNRLYFITSLLYYFQRNSSRTLPFPRNESKEQLINSFSQFDYIASAKQIITATFHFAPQHINFVNPDYFNPQPVTPTYAQHVDVGTASDHLALWGGILDSSISIQRFNVFVGAQGNANMILTPEGNQGNYFGTQNRHGRRTEWIEHWSPSPLSFLGTHLVKVGTSFTQSGEDNAYGFHPIEIVNSAGQLLESLTFTNPGPFNRTDREVTAFAQDHWSLNPKLAFDYGGRVEHQRLASSLRIAPRIGLAWSPFGERTVFRVGYGQFYDHIPLDVYGFSRYPQPAVTFYGPKGTPLGPPIQYVDVIGAIDGPHSFLVHGQRVAGAFAPRGQTFNAQLEHNFSKMLRARAVFIDSHSVGLIELQPEVLGSVHEIGLNGDGSSRYRQLELTAKLSWKEGQQLIFSYTRSLDQGSLNGYDAFLANYPLPLIRPNVYSNLPGNIPNRFLMWGHVKLPLKFQIDPIVEYRNGFPYAQFDALQNYVGTPYSDATRFRNFLSVDARLLRDFRISPKYTVRLSLTTFNITNHFNPLEVHANTDDPMNGIFFGNYHRRYRGDFEVIF